MDEPDAPAPPGKKAAVVARPDRPPPPPTRIPFMTPSSCIRLTRGRGRLVFALAIQLCLVPAVSTADAQGTETVPSHDLQVETNGSGRYRCPPCGADCHGPEHAWDEPGACPVCGMALVRPDPAPARERPAPSLAALAAYEGRYEDGAGGTLQLAASPADTTLYAFIAGSRYPLSATARPDTFRNAPGAPVAFVRDGTGAVAGYTLPEARDGRVYRRLGDGAPVPEAVWFPRLAARDGTYQYAYAVPDDLGDGLPVEAPGRRGETVLDPRRLRAMIQRIAEGAYPGVHSVLVLEGGALVLEEYFYEYDRATPHQLRSATKSVISALVGIAIDQGLLGGVDDPVLPYFGDLYDARLSEDDEKARITIGDLLTQRSGLACDDWNPASPGNEVRMGQAEDRVRFVLDLPMAGGRGEEARYCSGGVVVLGRLVELAAGVPLEAFAERHLFEPLGIETYEWRFNPDHSTGETFSQLWLRPRDMAKLGLLYANGGRWNGRQVVSEQWVNASLLPHTTLGDTDYGYLWWRPYLNVSGGAHHGLSAQGNGGQEIQIWPGVDLVVVLTGGNFNRRSPTNRLLIDYILPPFPTDG